jgi:excisionase family DNA binding protein
VKTNTEISVSERDRQRAMSVDQFSVRYGLGRTKIYEEIKSGRLRARKCGKRTIISEDDAEDWLRRLPLIEPKAAS